MNCDQAFDLMTDPALDDSTELHQHLANCPRCRQMYETLSPALGLFERAMTPADPLAEEAGGASSLEVAERVAIRLAKTSSAPRHKHHRRLALAAYLAAGVIGFVSALGLAGMLSEPSAAPPLLSEECTWLNRESADDNPQAGAVVLSCVACHLTNPVETSRLDLQQPVLAHLMN